MTAAVQTPFPAGPLGQPDIGYAPDHEKYLTRIKKRLQSEKLAKALPAGFPEKLDSELVWDGNSLAETYDWNYQLTEADLAEVEAALRHFKCMYAWPATRQWGRDNVRLTTERQKIFYSFKQTPGLR